MELNRSEGQSSPAAGIPKPIAAEMTTELPVIQPLHEHDEILAAPAGGASLPVERQMRVCWEIDVIATSPVQAAMEAERIQKRPESIANVFTVFDGGTKREIDLDLFDMNITNEVELIEALEAIGFELDPQNSIPCFLPFKLSSGRSIVVADQESGSSLPHPWSGVMVGLVEPDGTPALESIAISGEHSLQDIYQQVLSWMEKEGGSAAWVPDDDFLPECTPGSNHSAGKTEKEARIVDPPYQPGELPKGTPYSLKEAVRGVMAAFQNGGGQPSAEEVANILAKTLGIGDGKSHFFTSSMNVQMWVHDDIGIQPLKEAIKILHKDLTPYLHESAELFGRPSIGHSFDTPENKAIPDLQLENFCSLRASVVRGTNEGWYVHLEGRPILNGSPSQDRLLASSKCWSFEAATQTSTLVNAWINSNL